MTILPPSRDDADALYALLAGTGVADTLLWDGPPAVASRHDGAGRVGGLRRRGRPGTLAEKGQGAKRQRDAHDPRPVGAGPGEERAEVAGAAVDPDHHGDIADGIVDLIRELGVSDGGFDEHVGAGQRHLSRRPTIEQVTDVGEGIVVSVVTRARIAQSARLLAVVVADESDVVAGERVFFWHQVLKRRLPVAATHREHRSNAHAIRKTMRR